MNKLAIFMTIVAIICAVEGTRLPAQGADAHKLAQAKALRSKGAQLLREGKQVEALSAYKESLELQHNPNIEAFVKKLEGMVGKQKTKQKTKQKAKQKTKSFEPARSAPVTEPPPYSASFSSGSNLFRHLDPAFSITFPDHWETAEGVYGALVHSVEPKRDANDAYQENIRIVTSELEGGLGAEEYWRPNKKALVETLPQCSVIDKKNTRINGTAAVRAVVRYNTASDGNLTMLLYLFTHHGRGYTISATSPTSEYHRYSALFDQAIGGFTFSNGRSK